MGNYFEFASEILSDLGLVDFYNLDTLTEYFKNNIPVFSEHSDKFYRGDAYKHPFREYHFNDDASLYRMRTELYFRRIKFALENNISVLRALNANQELMLFFREDNILNEEPYDRTYFKKQYINDKGAFHEIFFHNGNYAGSVTTMVYDRDELKNAIIEVEEEYPGLTVLSNMSFVSDIAKRAGLKPKRIIRVFNVPNNGYWVVESDSDGNEISREKTSGYYLYGAYYNYMVEQGLFTSYEEKKENSNREKIA